jgi:inorganic triphosphatase YgiF
MNKIKPKTPVLLAAQDTISPCLDELWSFHDKILHNKNRDSLHQMRLAAKNLRYNMELFSPFYSDSFQNHLKEMKKIQEYLGDIHDEDVQVDNLKKRIRSYIKQQSDQFKDIEKAIKKENIKTETVRSFRQAVAETGYCGLVRLMQDQIASRQKHYKAFIRYWKKLNKNKVYDSIIKIISFRDQIEKEKPVS